MLTHKATYNRCVMQVLDNNVFDQRMRAHKSAQPSSNHIIVSDMDIDNQAATSNGTQKDSWTMYECR